ncbi:MAG: phage tail sheath family protein [Methylophilus sp.]|uniref:phage tail sheath family protein n=1 Tax=Methylophilus sp. TaxID=29541 RepID=UPI003FA0D668
MAQYKTPGVYVAEIPSLPPSIAAVETAMPAFIGYTEKAEQRGKSLTLVPFSISSMVEYEQYFGLAPTPAVTLWLDDQNQIADATLNQAFYLYDSLRLFFNNGGGACVIVSVGDYSNAVAQAALALGLAKIEDSSLPTIIVIPEAVLLEDHGVSLYAAALAQCAQVRNRVTICELGCQAEKSAFAQEAEHFRSNIGSEHLNYGAAYGPWLVSSFNRETRLSHLVLKRKGNAIGSQQAEEPLDAATLLVDHLTSDAAIKSKVIDLALSERACALLASGETGLLKNAPSVEQAAANLSSDIPALNSTDINAYQALLHAQSLWFLALLDIMSAVVKECPDTTLIKFSSIISSQAHTRMGESLRLLVAHHHALVGHTGISLIADTAACTLLGLKDRAAILALSPLPEVAADYAAASTDLARVQIAHDMLNSIIHMAIAWFREVQLSAQSTARALNHDLYQNFNVYRAWLDRAALALNTLPASGAIAGVYAQTDASRGVWKAPANVALQAVIKPVLNLTDDDQADYNVHPTGKSINIISSFTGRGTLVWGARTLAGNDNEWRYINVRRLFGMVEASIENGLQAYVFEPNDANTWLRAKAAVENFLTTLWQQGALLGSQPKQAFFVNIGLGSTMNAQDIVDGRLIVEIGLAPVRPAEFIILRFKLKMQQS